ncbi:MAG: thioredoxin domain-containing protein [Alphaproteobacteria bacterium]|nr:thioredoxin domain-containing protein [Alphaproteobacteria bacterium]
MALNSRTRLWLMAVVGLKVVALGGYGYAEGWFGGLFGGKPKAAAVAPAAPAVANMAPLPSRAQALQIQPNDRVLGRFGAPVTIIEYASMTCSHCADFKETTMPSVTREWLDTGKAVYVLRDLPWDNLALGMSAVARCVPANQFYAMSNALFAAQKRIITGNPMAEINAVAAQAGLNEAAVQACIRDEARQQEILRSKEIARQVLGVKGTPAIFVNGTPVEGAVKYDVLKKTLDAEYAKATAAHAK